MRNRLKRWAAAALFIVSVLGATGAQAAAKFTVSDTKGVATIYVAESEPYSIRRAVGDLQSDIEMVTGKKPKITHDLNSISGRAIIIGEAKSPAIDALIKSSAAAEAKGMEKMFEAFVMKAIKSPTPKIKEALLIAGSDALGTVYGVYQLSELSGVSPLYWWCDAKPERREALTVEGVNILPKQPSVKYRGIFINDEEALIHWSSLTTEGGRYMGITPESYKHVFELILRMRANMLWPSMMEAGRYFFEAKDENGVAINPRNATDYGIYVGASHCEQMGRNNYDEWYRWAAANAEKYNIVEGHEFDYTVNPKAIEAYWMERLQESKDFNMIYTMGIRGVHDSPFQCRLLKNPTLENKVKLLQSVIDRQRAMIKEVFGSEDGARQIFVPYEETGEIYNGESKDGKEKCAGLNLPEDIVLVVTEDNHSYLRQTPTAKELKRKGGNGFYYHLAYQGSPSTYDWLTTTPYSLMREQLTKGYYAGAKDYWIVNVGDIKPAEMGIQYFMRLANDIEKWSEKNPREYIAEQSAILFGTDAKQSAEVAELYSNFTQTAYRHRPEFMGSFASLSFEPRGQFQFYSPFDFGDEAQQAIESFASLRNRAKAIYDTLGEEHKMAFWHLVYYPTRAAHDMAERCYYYHKNYHYAKQGRYASLNKYMELSKVATKRVREDLNYYNTAENGKWNGIVDPYAEYNIFERVFDIACITEHFLFDEKYREDEGKGIGSVCEGQKIGNEKVTLRFSKGEDNKRFIDIFNLALTANNFKVSADKPYVKATQTSGSVSVEERVWLSVDYSAAPKGRSTAVVTVSGEGHKRSYQVTIENYDTKLKSKSYMEGCGYVVVEAESYSRKSKGTDGAEWSEYQDYGYIGSSMFVKGGKSKVTNIAAAARLEYDVYFHTAGTHQGWLYRIPTLNEGKGNSVELAVGLNDQKPMTLEGIRAKSSRLTKTLPNGVKDSRTWFNNVAEQMEKIPFLVEVDKAGYHTLKIYQRDCNIGVDRVVIATDKEAQTAVSRTVVGAPVSYNSFGLVSHLRVPRLPKIDGAEVQSYPNPEPIPYVKLGFSKYGCPEVWGFNMMSPNNIFDPNVNLFGWSKESVKNARFKHHESMRRVPHWKRDCNYGTAPATFCVKLIPGNYEMNLYTGDYFNEFAQKPGWDYKMSVVANGKVLMDNQLIKYDNPHTGCYEVTVEDDCLLEIEFSCEAGAKWAVSAIELYHK